MRTGEPRPDMPPLPTRDGIEFRHCPGHAGYAIASDGTAWSCRNRWGYIAWRRLRAAMRRDGYWQVSILGVSTKNATLVAEAFIGPRPPCMEVCHEDGNRTNDAPSNLRWDTHHANILDTVRHGRAPRAPGERQWMHKLTTQQVLDIRSLAGTMRQVDIAEKFGIKQANVSAIILRYTWRHLP